MKKNAEAMYNEAKGIKAVGDSAEKAKKQLMGFDEINRLSDPKTGTGGTGKNRRDGRFQAGGRA